MCCYIAYALIFCGTQAYTLRDDISVVPGVLVGQSTRNDDVFSTGVTTVLCPGSCNAAAAQLGGAPCTAQTDPLSLSNLGTNSIAGVVLTGGSILGLYGSSDGVVSCVANATREQFPGQLVLSGFSLPQIPSAALLDLLYQNLKTHGASAAFQRLNITRHTSFLLFQINCVKSIFYLVLKLVIKQWHKQMDRKCTAKMYTYLIVMAESSSPRKHWCRYRCISWV